MSPEEVRARLGGPELKRLFEAARHATSTIHCKASRGTGSGLKVRIERRDWMASDTRIFDPPAISRDTS